MSRGGVGKSLAAFGSRTGGARKFAFWQNCIAEVGF